MRGTSPGSTAVEEESELHTHGRPRTPNSCGVPARHSPLSAAWVKRHGRLTAPVRPALSVVRMGAEASQQTREGDPATAVDPGVERAKRRAEV